ncbi:hypothetical protein [Planctobacterium marinum]|uniref:Pullulanase n=1 Tax=Planctobacterium marinum TaxID=1631968 RepID=A0AA48HMB6_9ALTE|nr:hypothetical protein MACH26_00050 [Planctobacterium marinum]
MKFKSLFSTLLITATLAGCSSTKTFVDGLDNDKPSYGELYLRGSFTWWEADDAYKVVQFEENIYRVVVELVADGQPYDFKFADKAWSEGLSCGYKNKDSDEYLKLNKTVSANCNTPVDNFVFVPKESGKYIFQIDFSGWSAPKVSVFKM